MVNNNLKGIKVKLKGIKVNPLAVQSYVSAYSQIGLVCNHWPLYTSPLIIVNASIDLLTMYNENSKDEYLAPSVSTLSKTNTDL